jgi:hypothetical protein
MKTMRLAAGVLLLGVSVGFSQSWSGMGAVGGNYTPYWAQTRAERELDRRDTESGYARHPFRSFNGVVLGTRATNFVRFYGEVLGTQSGGVRIEGGFVRASDPSSTPYRGEFLVKNFPWDVADGSKVGWELCMLALPTENVSYVTVLGGTRKLRALDYGIPCAAPIVQGSTVATNRTAKAAEVSHVEAALKKHQELAAAGDDYGLLRMGERYIAGDGVERSEKLAREYFEKAAAKGNADAAAALAKLGASQASR